MQPINIPIKIATPILLDPNTDEDDDPFSLRPPIILDFCSNIYISIVYLNVSSVEPQELN